MTIFDLYSKRQKRLRGEIPDVYTYDELSDHLCAQIIYIWDDALGDSHQYWDDLRSVKELYQFIVEALRREYGLFFLPGTNVNTNPNYREELTKFFLQEVDVEKCIDVIELTFRTINKFTRRYDYLHRNNASEIADNAISELNSRFKEHGIGFQFVENEIVRVDSELIHVEAVKPALRLLNSKDYEGAQQEFLSAYEHYRHGKQKEALSDCLKSFESVMKSICDKRGWIFESNATAKKLIDVCFEKGLIPNFWQNQLKALRSLLEGSIPTGRNKLSGHGQGSQPIDVPDHLVAYMLHMTASTLVFLVTAEEQLE